MVSFSEVAGKFVVPITNMILAGCSHPGAFGVVAILQYARSVFVDLIHRCRLRQSIWYSMILRSEEEKERYADVSFGPIWVSLP